MKQSQYYYLLRRGLFRSISSAVREGLVMFNKFTTAGISHPAQGSAEFDGSSDYIQLNEPFSYTNHTIAAWVYVNDDATDKYVLSAQDGGSDGIGLFLRSNEQVRYRLVDSSLTSTNTYSSEWIFVTATYDGTTQKLYIDGSQDQSATVTKTVSNTTDARIGSRSYSLADYFNGNLANVAIWNRALSSDEINSVMWKSYDGLTASETSGLQAWYSLDDISGSSVPDSSGNGNNGTAY